MSGTITKVSGPLVVAEGLSDANISDVVRVGSQRLIGEILNMTGDSAAIQVYEETAGLGRGDIVVSTGAPLSVELGPGLITNIFDGIQRPLEKLRKTAGSNIIRGIDEPALDRDKVWHFEADAKTGDTVSAGDIYGTVMESELVLHKIMVPPNISGIITEIKSGDYKVTDFIGKLKDDKGTVSNISLMQKWPVRRARPYVEKLPPNEPLITGQRTIDAIFPIAKGGAACIPGPFGSGKTVVQHQLAKWSDADIVIYVGCGERGNEMTDVLLEFPELKDPKSGKSLMNAQCLSPIHRTCRSRHARRRYIRESLSLNISAIWVIRWRLSPTQHRAGRKRFAKCQAVSKKCPVKKDIPHILPHVWRSFMSAQELLFAAVRKNASALLPRSELFRLREATFPNR
jgi:V/A-type H+-transporting ATPase subunit A